MKKVGLITIYHVPNYGSVLQTYATQTLLEKLGCKCNIINYKYPNEYHYSLGRPKQSIKSKIGSLLGLSAGHRKANKLEAFKKKHFNFTKLYSHLNELKTANWEGYDMFVVGSDQVWKSKFTLGDTAFLLSFVPDYKKRVSIASSFATSSVPEEYRETYKRELEKFNAISVRENNGISIIKDELKLNKDVQVVLDPTLLLSKEDWLSAVPRSTFKKKKKYILLYMLTYAFEPRPYIFEVLKQLQSQEDYDIIALEGYTPKERANGIEMINKADSSIPEFIDLFANADVVVTSSFHGTAFAVNFGIPLISIVPGDKGDDRQSSFLKNVGLNGCIATAGTAIDNINYRYAPKKAEENLAELRRKSIEWIKDKVH
ncbi:MAG: polysaccharide pyruvyl transferase family protein [Bacteroidaceae bacterium]|nr:polysaccharide pyruvyl transferase family protein [Bacteroidaceae bacterium]